MLYLIILYGLTKFSIYTGWIKTDEANSEVFMY